MDTSTNIAVKTASGECPVFVANGVLPEIGGIAASRVSGRTARVVTDSNVAPLHLEPVLASLRAAGFSASATVVPAGEATKTFAGLPPLWEDFHAAGITRRDLVVALGGGVVGDLAGFAAATWLRGVAFVQAPTSLLAFVDSSIGGKTAVDLPFGKNLAGAFHQPVAVVSDPLVLHTLPPREFSQGMAEAAKTACILDEAFFRFFESFAGRKPTDAETETVIRRCAAAKADVVSRDEKEGGLRAILNFGHTVGHAIEKILGYGTVPHGEAVAVGMVAAAKIGNAVGRTPDGVADRIEALLRALSLPTRVSDLPGGAAACTPEAVAAATLSDKKKLGADVHFVVLEEIGRAAVEPLSPGRLEELLPDALRSGGAQSDAQPPENAT